MYNDAPVSQEIPQKPNDAIKLTYSHRARTVRMFPLHYAIFSALWPLKTIIKQLSLSVCYQISVKSPEMMIAM